MNNIELNKKYILNIELLYKTNKNIQEQNIEGNVIQKLSNNTIIFKSKENKFFDSLYGKLIILGTDEFKYTKIENISSNLFLIESESKNEFLNTESNVGIFLTNNNKKSLFMVFKGFFQECNVENNSNVYQLSISEPFDFIIENKTTLFGKIVKIFSTNCVLFQSNIEESFKINNKIIDCKFFLLTTRYTKDTIKHLNIYEGIVNIGILNINDFSNKTKEDLQQSVCYSLIGNIKQKND